MFLLEVHHEESLKTLILAQKGAVREVGWPGVGPLSLGP